MTKDVDYTKHFRTGAKRPFLGCLLLTLGFQGGVHALCSALGPGLCAGGPWGAILARPHSFLRLLQSVNRRFYSPSRIRQLRRGGAWWWRATCAGAKQEVTAGVEPGESVAFGADGSGEGAGEGTLVSRLFSPSGLGCRAVTRACSCLEIAKGCPREGRSWRSRRGLWQVAEEGGCSGPLCSTLG